VAEIAVKGLRTRKSCIVLLAIMLLSPLVCYGAVWLFARFGGDLATSGDLPVPDGSQFVVAVYEDDYYDQKHSIYLSQSSPEELREWFIQAGFGMTPIPLDMEGKSVIDYDNYYGTPGIYSPISAPQMLHMYSVALISGVFDDGSIDCQDIRVYTNRAALASDFGFNDIPDGRTAFVTTTCWRNAYTSDMYSVS
jgi:hypothetical protein